MSRAFAAQSHLSHVEHDFDVMPQLRYATRLVARLIAFTLVSGGAVAAVIAIRIVAFWH